MAGVKKVIFEKNEKNSNKKKICTYNQKYRYDLGRHQIFFIKIVTLETGDMPQ
jgi:hypothetical protein